MICEQCYLRPGCHRRIAEDERCDFYVKKSAIKLGEDSDVNPMDTVEFEYSDLKQMLGESRNDEDRKRKRNTGTR